MTIPHGTKLSISFGLLWLSISGSEMEEITDVQLTSGSHLEGSNTSQSLEICTQRKVSKNGSTRPLRLTRSKAKSRLWRNNYKNRKKHQPQSIVDSMD